jgi:SAM-dependent methyltransferase
LIADWLPGAKEIERTFLNEAASVVGADVDSQSLAVPSSIRRIACQLEALAFDDGAFDFITCNMVVEHLSAPAKVFKEFFRVLRPGGVVIILTPNIYHWANIVSMLTPFWFHRWSLKTLFNREPEDVFPTLYRCNTERTVRRLLGSAGFPSVTVHMVPGRQRLIEFGPLFYLEYMFYQLSMRYSQLREILCAVAQKLPDEPPKP